MKCSSSVSATKGIAAVALSAALAAGCFGLVAPQESAYAVSAAQKAAEAESAYKQLAAMQETLDQRSEEYINSLTEFQQAADARDAAQARIDELNEEIGEIQGRLGNRAREMYRNGSTSFLDMLLGSASFEELTLNWDLLTRVNQTDANLSSQARALRTEQEEQKTVLTEQAAVAEQKLNEANEAFEEAQELVEEMQATYDALSEEAVELLAQEQAAAANAAGYATQGGYVNDDGTVTDIQTGQTYSSPSAYTAATGNSIVDRARAMIGSNYVWGGVGGSDGGFDCSGLVSYAITGQNTRIGTSYTFQNLYQRTDNPQAGDLYVTDGHVAIVTGDGTVVEAVGTGYGVQERPLREKSGGYYLSTQ